MYSMGLVRLYNFKAILEQVMKQKGFHAVHAIFGSQVRNIHVCYISTWGMCQRIGSWRDLFLVRRHKWIRYQKNYLQQLQVAKHEKYGVRQALLGSSVNIRADLLLFTHLVCTYRWLLRPETGGHGEVWSQTELQWDFEFMFFQSKIKHSFKNKTSSSI